MGLPKARDRGGRPRKKAIKPGDRVPIGLRVTPQMKAAIDAAAANSGRSQSQEIEMRLEFSFKQEKDAPDLIVAKYGRRIGVLLIMMGSAIKATGAGAAASGVLPMSTLADSWLGNDSWLDDPFLYDQATKAVSALLEWSRPEGDVTDPQLPRVEGEKELGTFAAEMLIELWGEKIIPAIRKEVASMNAVAA